MEKLREYFKRFKKFNFTMWVTSISMFIFSVIGLYFSIGMTVKICSNLTLFGNSSNTKNEIEITGPSSNDVIVVVTFWILTVLLTLTFVYFTFIKKYECLKEEVNNENNNNNNNKDEALKEDNFKNNNE